MVVILYADSKVGSGDWLYRGNRPSLCSRACCSRNGYRFGNHMHERWCLVELNTGKLLIRLYVPLFFRQVGRSMEKLQALEVELERKHGCKVLIIKVPLNAINKSSSSALGWYHDIISLQADFTDVSVLPVIVQKLKEEKVEVGNWCYFKWISRKLIMSLMYEYSDIYI